MSAERRLLTSEACCMGHPDKVADQISDAILDDLLRQDPDSRVAIEVMLKSGLAIVAGEVTTRGYVEISQIVKQVIREVGYTDPISAFNCFSVGILTCLEPQSSDIAEAVNEDPSKKKELGAGDQGIMYGFACSETPEYMPMPIALARRLVLRSAEVREKGVLPYLRPDGKSQVTVEYEGNRPARVHTVVLSLQHDEKISLDQLRRDFEQEIVRKAIPGELLNGKVTLHMNPSGRFVQGGPQNDCGLTGRKLIVDTYGGMARHGGGSFSGKDPTKVDRSGTYYARYVAKNIVAAGLAERCEVQLAYAIGIPEPVGLAVETAGTGTLRDERLHDLVRAHFDFRPRRMIAELDLRRPIYKSTARFGHFGLTGPEYTWERTDKADLLRREAARFA